MARSGGAVVRTPAKSFCSDAGVLDFRLQLRDVTQLPERGTSGSVQRGPANPARPGREQRYRERLLCRRSPEVPLFKILSEVTRAVPATGVHPANELPGYSPQVAPTEIQRSSWTRTRHENAGECDQERSR